MDLFLVIFVVCIVGMAIYANVRILMYYQQPEDAKIGASLFGKVVIVVSLTLAWVMNILLPIDVRNSRPRPGSLDMELMWTIAFMTLAVFLGIVVPSVMFYMEIEGDDVVKHKRRYVFCNLFLLLFFSGCAVGISYPFLADAYIPVVQYGCDAWLEAGETVDVADMEGRICTQSQSADVHIKVGFHIYLIAVLCFIGWFFFVIFGGIGLGAVPLDFILDFVDRPRACDEATYQQRRRMLGQAATRLIERAALLQTADGELMATTGWRAARQKRQAKGEYNKFKRDVLLLETEFERLVVSKFHKGENLAVSVAKLIIGIFSAILSIMWVFQIILCILVPQVDPSADIQFIDGIFTACEGGGLYPLGVAFFALFTLYLLVCVVKGCLKFGMRLFFLFSIHPMRHQATPLNSILFNVEMVLITSAAVVQFSQTAFANYARLTDADIIFSAQVKYMSFYSWFFENNVFIYSLFGWFLLTIIYLFAKPRDNQDFRIDKKSDKQLASILGKPKDAAGKSRA